MNTAVLSPLASIAFRHDARLIRLTDPSDWERAARSGMIAKDTKIAIEHGAITEAVDAGTVRELAPFFTAGVWAPRAAETYAEAA